ncbi:MAG TPA: carboxypeptidase-like regulatory domain-containing protein, partial [Candidatus Avibacteroides excrementipullorum]|nr:carboxypeptidase-like regulatory domain-containing protein [Candidatus Avibacteroides excrementipullorum]
MLAACFGEISAQTASGGGEVSGLIVTDTGEPVIGAAVIEKGTSNGTVTDLDGHFSFTVSDAGSEIVASYVGYKSVSFKAGTGLKIVLVEDSKVL